MTFDNNGNLTGITDASGTTIYSWNARNQLTGISGPSVSASFVYDGLGRREKKTVNSNLTEFLYDGVNPVQETSGATVLANMLTGLGIDEFLTRSDSTGTSYFLPDALGSTVGLADSAGTVQTENTYEPFGKTTTSGASTTNPFQFTGRENDGTGLYYYRARYYQPQLQRFVSEDPIFSPAFAGCPGNESRLLSMAFSAGSPLTQAPNLYAYVGNRPNTYTDPSGLGPCEDTLTDCLQRVSVRQLECLENVFLATAICTGGCLVLCTAVALPPSPAFVVCVNSCIASVCARVAAAGSAACTGESASGRINCVRDYMNCRNRQSKSAS